MSPASNTRLERTRHERTSLLSCVGEPLKRINVGHLRVMKRRLHEKFGMWSLRLMAVSLIIIVVTLMVAPVSKLFIAVAFGLGMLDSLSTMEELTGGREIFLFSIPVMLAGDFFLQLILFAPTTIAEKIALYIQFASVIVLTESVIVFLLRSRLEEFRARRALK